MKIKYLIKATLIILFLSCGNDDNEEVEIINLPPTEFTVNVQQITDRSAILSWTPSTDPENSKISYKIYLNDNLIKDNLNELTLELTNLSFETEYIGKVISLDGLNTTVANFSFKTLSFIPKVYNGNVSLTSQQQVIDFGKNKYNVINGNLDIWSNNGGNSDINNLSPLIDLMEVKGFIEIKLSALSNLDGLNNLSKIGGDRLSIYYNDFLTKLSGLENITELNGDLKIYNNKTLENIDLPKNTAIFNGGIIIQNNPTIKSINIFNKLETLKFISIGSNSSLENILGFETLKKVEGKIEFYSNNLLNSLSVFKNVTTIGASLIIEDTDIINVGFSKLELVKGSISLMNNNSLETLNDIINLNSIEGNLFSIWNNQNLKDFCGISSLVNNNGFKGSLSIVGNALNPTVTDFKNGLCK